MAWRDELLKLRNELDARIDRLTGYSEGEEQEIIDEREEIYQLAADLQIAQLLVDINQITLSGTGRVESTSMLDFGDDDDMDDEMLDLKSRFDDPMGDDDGEDEDEDFLDEGEELRFTLYWDDLVECAVDVELGKRNDRVFLLVNGEEVRHNREVLETALVDAFRKEMEKASLYEDELN